jgi:ASC-1-like (ASCH) protein
MAKRQTHGRGHRNLAKARRESKTLAPRCKASYNGGGRGMKHLMHLTNNAFERIKNGEKTVELRLFDEKRQKINVRDLICFYNDNESQKLFARVTGYMRYSSFAELFDRIDDVSRLGYRKCEKPNPEHLRKFYTAEDEKKYGVIGIVFELDPTYKPIEEMTEQEVSEYIKRLVKGACKMQRKLEKNIDENDDILEALTKFVDVNPELFFANTDPINHDIFKWVLVEHKKRIETLLDVFMCKEDDICYPAHYEYEIINGEPVFPLKPKTPKK